MDIHSFKEGEFLDKIQNTIYNKVLKRIFHKD